MMRVIFFAMVIFCGCDDVSNPHVGQVCNEGERAPCNVSGYSGCPVTAYALCVEDDVIIYDECEASCEAQCGDRFLDPEYETCEDGIFPEGTCPGAVCEQCRQIICPD